jgi:hypothetical protein
MLRKIVSFALNDRSIRAAECYDWCIPRHGAHNRRGECWRNDDES